MVMSGIFFSFHLGVACLELHAVEIVFGRPMCHLLQSRWPRIPGGGFEWENRKKLLSDLLENEE